MIPRGPDFESNTITPGTIAMVDGFDGFVTGQVATMDTGFMIVRVPTNLGNYWDPILDKVGYPHVNVMIHVKDGWFAPRVVRHNLEHLKCAKFVWQLAHDLSGKDVDCQVIIQWCAARRKTAARWRLDGVRAMIRDTLIHQKARCQCGLHCNLE